MRFLPVSFPVFPRQIARYPPCKNRKISSKETLKPDPGKIQTGFTVHTNNYFYIYILHPVVSYFNTAKGIVQNKRVKVHNKSLAFLTFFWCMIKY